MTTEVGRVLSAYDVYVRYIISYHMNTLINIAVKIPTHPRSHCLTHYNSKVPLKMTTTLPSSSFELGGTVPTACLCLLDGFEQDSASGEKTRVTIPITTLPATLGRSNDENDGDDPHFFGLGKKKALSRKQCRISYRDAEGGHVERDGATGELIFREKSALGNQGKLPTEGDEDLPPRGFFVIECLGKNRIMVNQDRVEHGDAAVLEDGSALRISSYWYGCVKN